ncbi:MAG: class I tRNA ligase family protein [Evtepia sp.]
MVRLRLHPLCRHGAATRASGRLTVYIEGLDQYRGWFQAALLTAVGSTGVAKAPFKTCITHGWTVDGEGKAMHKSLGNGVDPYDIMNKYGADLHPSVGRFRRLPRGHALL